MFAIRALFVLCLAAGSALAAPPPDSRVTLGQVQTGARMAFVRTASGEWGIEIAGASAPRMAQAQPARVEVMHGEANIRQLAAGYKTVRFSESGVAAHADLADTDGVVFHVDDVWRVRGAVIGNAKQFFFMRQADRADLTDLARDLPLPETALDAIQRYPLPEHWWLSPGTLCPPVPYLRRPPPRRGCSTTPAPRSCSRATRKCWRELIPTIWR